MSGMGSSPLAGTDILLSLKLKVIIPEQSLLIKQLFIFSLKFGGSFNFMEMSHLPHLSFDRAVGPTWEEFYDLPDFVPLLSFCLRK